MHKYSDSGTDLAGSEYTVYPSFAHPRPCELSTYIDSLYVLVQLAGQWRPCLGTCTVSASSLEISMYGTSRIT